MADLKYDVANEEGGTSEVTNLIGTPVEEVVEAKSHVSFMGSLKLFLLAVCAASLTVMAVNSTFERIEIRKDLTTINSLEEIPRGMRLSDASDDERSHMFGLFQQKFGRTYDGEESTQRMGAFKQSLEHIDARNEAEQANGGSARHGITKFSDISHEEFSSRYLNKALQGRKPNGFGKDRERGVPKVAEVEKYTGSETSADWSKTLATPIRDQGYCGSCWAFSTVSQIESDAIRAGILTASESDYLSPEQLIACDKADLACNGGWTELGMAYAHDFGLELESDYKYTSYYQKVDECSVDDSKFVVSVDQFYIIDSEESMMDYVLSTGPLSVCMDSDNWATYIDGVLTTCGENVDHCVQVTGVNTDEGWWKVRNTWGTDWGEEGYIRVATGSNMCGIATDPLYATVSKYETDSPNTVALDKFREGGDSS